jgi:protein gp37
MHPSTIEWTEATWNPIRGCVKVSPGCKHCYAEAFAKRFRGVPGHPYEQGFDVRLVPHRLSDPLRWTRPTTIFVNSMSDLFQEDVPTAYIRTVVDIMLLAPMYYLIHATDHPEAPFLMYRAYNHTTLPKESPEQLQLELGLIGRRGRGV